MDMSEVEGVMTLLGKDNRAKHCHKHHDFATRTVTQSQLVMKRKI